LDRKSNIKKLTQIFNTPHIVVGHGFRENGKVGAAYDNKCYPWMGDVYISHFISPDPSILRQFEFWNKRGYKIS